MEDKKENQTFPPTDDGEIRIQKVEKEDIPEVLDFIDEIYEEMPDKSWLTKDSRENMTRYMTSSGFALKAEVCDEKGEHELAAIFVSRTSELGDENLGIYMNLDKEQLEHVAHMELSMVGKNYRGKGIQKKLMENAEKRLKAMGYCWLMGKAHPENIYSANNYQRLGYETVAEIKMSDGSPRSIFGKKIQ